MTANRRIAATVTVILVMLLLTGCWDKSELEDQSYIIVMGLDKGDGGDVVVTVLVALVQELSVGTLQSPIQPTAPRLAAETLTARAGTIQQAVHILNGGMTRRLDLRHLRTVVVGEDLAREGLEPLLMELARTPLSRGSGSLFLARGSANKVLRSLRPIGELNPSRMAEGLILQAKQMHLSPPVRMHHFVNRLAAGVDPYLPVLAINPQAEEEPGPPETGGETSALPGELPRRGGNPVESIGTAVFRKDKLVGYLNVDETQMLLALRGEMGKSNISFADPDVPERQVTLRFHQENLPKYRESFRGNRPHVALNLLFEGEVLAVPGGTDYTRPAARERLRQASEAYVDRTVRGLLEKLQEWSADPVGFSLLFRGRFADWYSWEAYDWHSHLKDLTVDVTAQMRVRRFGLLRGRDRVDQGRR